MNKIIRCAILDDEPLAREIIEEYISKVPFLALAISCSTVWELHQALAEKEIDLIFLDIEMPEMDGLTFIKTTIAPPKVIFITAHRHYAVDAFEIRAVDYLLKPVSFTRFLKAVNNAKSDSDSLAPQIKQAQANSDYIFINIERNKIKLEVNEIAIIEASGDYLKIKKIDKTTLITKSTLQKIQQELPTQYFKQIHRSFVINTRAVTAYNQNQVKVGEQWLKISRTFKGQLDF
jgi:DNA-binding LytR/AlgR family response regulator